MLAALEVYRPHFHRFRRLKRGYYSLWLLAFLLLVTAGAELWINHRAWWVHYENHNYFPLLQGFYSEQTFGGSESYEADYRKLQARWEKAGSANYVLLPLVPFDPYESDFLGDKPPPYAPSAVHWLGTDTLGRDIFARLVYAFRITFIFSILLYALNTMFGVCIGCLMGFFGGWFDLLMQRFIEVWSNLPLLYVLVILGSILTPSIGWLLLVFALFNWTGITWLMRAEILREKGRTYALSARALGLGPFTVLFRHLLPNALVPILVNLPFSIVGGISILTSLDFLGYGLPVPTPSWGEMLKQGQQTFEFAPWIVMSPSVATVGTLLLFSFIGETLRDSFDPKTGNFYR